MSQRIVKCRIGPPPQPLEAKAWRQPMPEVAVVYADGTEEVLFRFYPDELRFVEREFIGLTRDEALQLRNNRDVEYLRT